VNGIELASILVMLFCCSYVLVLVMCGSEMTGGRDDEAIVEALATMAQVLSQTQT